MAGRLTTASSAFHVLSKMFAKELSRVLTSFAATARNVKIFALTIVKKLVRD